ncbi:MAG TPA: flagellar motor protein MotA [Stellaceae bacterium]|nr:flagellar motor protein MotA [Stellaceae bacterium]
MSRPQRYLIRMAIFLVVVAVIAVSLGGFLASAFLANAALNGIIAAVLLIGIGFIFRQVWRLNPEVAWIEAFRVNKRPPTDKLPQLLSPMANMLGDRGGHRMSLSATSMRTLLDGIGARLDESRETSRYLIGVLVFLGLLGTFYGLLETVRSVAGVINGLNVGGNDIARAMNDLKANLEAPLRGMGTAFSSSLFGLAGSLVLGFLDLQAGQAQNRFFNELEEWLSGLTRLGSGSLSEGGDQPVPAFIQALLEQTADSLENLQRIMSRGEESRIAANQGFTQFADKLGTLTDQMRAEQTLLIRLAENQRDLQPVLARLADATTRSGGGLDETTKTHIRNMDTRLARLGDELSQGRDHTVQEIRSEIRLLARTIAALAEESEQR